MNRIIAKIFILLSLFFTGCAQKELRTPITWAEIIDTGMMNENSLRHSLKAFRKSCISLSTKDEFSKLCKIAKTETNPLKFFTKYFEPKLLTSPDKSEYETLMTGYFEPLLHGSLEKSDNYKYPLYGVPLNKVDKTKTRKEIEDAHSLENVICWIDDELDLYFLQVQGSGRVLLDSGKTIFVGYKAQNGHPYTSIGKILTSSGEVDEDKISLGAIREWVSKNPDRKDWLLHQNRSYVFFAKETHSASGSLGVELTPEFSIAVDSRFIPMGYPVLLSTTHPLNNKPFSRLAMAQDRGGAIKGPVRADLFWGYGKYAKECAGNMKNDVRLWLLEPISLPSP